MVSDWNGIEQVPGCTKWHCPQAINAGIDLAMVPDDWKQFIPATIEDVRAGRIPMSRLDDAVSRIIRVKLKSGLFDASPAAGPHPDAAELNSPAVRQLAREAVRKSLVLLKNDRGALPLKRGARILVVGRGADSLPMQSGGWSLTWQGDQTTTADYPNADTLLAAMRKELGAGQVDYSPDGAGVDVRRYGAVVMVAAEKPYAEMHGDIVFPAPMRHTARYPEDLQALERVTGKGVPVVTVLYSGRPVPRTISSTAPTRLSLHGCREPRRLALPISSSREATAAKRYDFVGRLSFDWPAGDCQPRTGGVQFRRGYGLTLAGRSRVGHLPEAPVRASCPANSR